MNYKQFLAIYNQGPEEVYRLLKTYEKRIDSLSGQLQVISNRVSTLEFQTKKNSTNSHKPPSSDGLRKPKTNSLREKTGRPTGGQPGHKGHTLHHVSHPDYVIQHPVTTCDGCGESLEHQPVVRVKTRQMFDIPPIQLEVTQHETEVKKCTSCGTKIESAFPEDVQHHVQYGPNVQSMVLYMMHYQLVPFARTKEFFQDFFNLSISEGTLWNIHETFDTYLVDTFEPQARHQILQAPVVHFDETGLRSEGKTQWLHTLSTDQVTLQYVHEKRGTEAINEINLLPKFRGIAVHDCLASYFTYEKCEHAVCNAHILRDLKAVYEQTNQTWTQDMIEILLLAKQQRERQEEPLHPKVVAWMNDTYLDILKKGYVENATVANHDAEKLLNRLSKRQDSVLFFVEDPHVPFDNNLAERDLRMAKVKQKVSGTFRSETGAQNFAMARSFLSTLKKQKKNLFESIKQVIKTGKIQLFET
jgi:transposase